MEPITFAASISSERLSSICLPIYSWAIMLVLPAKSSINLNASHIFLRDSVRSWAIVIKAISPLCRQSCSMKVVPVLCSRSNDTDLSLHMWKKVLY